MDLVIVAGLASTRRRAENCSKRTTDFVGDKREVSIFCTRSDVDLEAHELFPDKKRQHCQTQTAV